MPSRLPMRSPTRPWQVAVPSRRWAYGGTAPSGGRAPPSDDRVRASLTSDADDGLIAALLAGARANKPQSFAVPLIAHSLHESDILEERTPPNYHR